MKKLFLSLMLLSALAVAQCGSMGAQDNKSTQPNKSDAKKSMDGCGCCKDMKMDDGKKNDMAAGGMCKKSDAVTDKDAKPAEKSDGKSEVKKDGEKKSGCC